MAEAPAQAPLDYQTPAARRRRRRRPLPIVRITLVLSGLVLLVVYCAEPVVKTVQSWPGKYHHSRCMSYSAPASQVVYDEDFDRSAAMLTSDPAHYRGQKSRVPPNDNSYVGRMAEPLKAWKGHHLQDDFPVFLHGRRSKPGAVERLIILCPVQGRWIVGAGQPVYEQFNCDADPAGRDDATKLVQSFPEVAFGRGADGADAVRYYAGQPDPNDQSHFTIDFDLGARRHGIIDGWLKDDDHVELRVRPGSGFAAGAGTRR